MCVTDRHDMTLAVKPQYNQPTRLLFIGINQCYQGPIHCSSAGVFPVCPIPFRLLPFRPTFLPISPSVVSPLTHFALYHFALLPPRPIIFSPYYHFALLPIHPLPIRPMPSRSLIIWPLHHFAQCHFAHLSSRPLLFHHSVSASQKLLTIAHDFLVLEPKKLPGTR